jgi:DMSO/TMAO reductase YedYZ molybdopterin-dependent catalytic subunit
MRPILDPSGFFSRIPLLPHQMTDQRTKTADVIVLCHMGVPRLSAEEWRLSIDGLVERSVTLTFKQLQQLRKYSVETVHQCAGSPLRPTVATRRVCNVTWGGARLGDVLAQAGLKDSARYVWSTGADYGSFDGFECSAYIKDLPLSRIEQDVLVAYELNGAPLAAEHGFPARLVVPGYYGTNSVKWLTRLTLAERRALGPFTTRWYNDEVLDETGKPTGGTVPVWSIAPESIITAPAEGVIELGVPCTVRGWAWADDGVGRVEVSCDGGIAWGKAHLEPRQARAWQAFSLEWTPRSAGSFTLMARAQSRAGEWQPTVGRRNEIHHVAVTVA